MRKLVVLFLSLVFAVGVWAQDSQTEETEQDAQAEQEVLDTELTPEELAAAENNELILEDSEVDEEDSTNSRFIPTEQISQDLGVSFPVDI
ncbi:MAG: hypothetical protein GKR91_16015 [Pseudomonadales bacterium]|nr:hypothetical protein [Pseudomonadales bacterium]